MSKTPEEQISALIQRAREQNDIADGEPVPVGQREFLLMFMGFLKSEENAQGHLLSQREVGDCIDEFVHGIRLAAPFLGIEIKL